LALSFLQVARNELASMQKETGFGTAELRKVMDSFKSHASFNPDHSQVNKDHFFEVMSDVFDGEWCKTPRKIPGRFF